LWNGLNSLILPLYGMYSVMKAHLVKLNLSFGT